MFKRWSNQQVQYYALLVFFTVLLTGLTLQVLRSSLECVDERGCKLARCKDFNFKMEYHDLINASSAANGDCPPL